MDNKKLDSLLKSVLKNAEQPSPELIRKVYNHMEESEMRKPTIKRSLSGVVVFAASLILLTTGVFAALHYLTPSQLAEYLEFPALAKAFESEDAVHLNETQSEEGYEVTLLGLVSGKGLEFNEEINELSTYAVVAFKNLNGQPKSNEDWFSLPFFVSPLIHGQEPWRYNIASMGGGYVSHVADGVMYHLIECESLEMFADRGLSLIVSSTSFYSTEAYDYDNATGLVTPNPNFDGINMIFDLPLDVSKADHEKAREYLDHLWDDAEVGNRRGQGAGASGEATPKIVSEEALTYDTLSDLADTEIARIQKLVDEGTYSDLILEKEKQRFTELIKELDAGNTIILYEFDDGSFSTGVHVPNDTSEVTYSEDGVITITDK